MSTPTREQVIEWARLTDPDAFHPDIELYADEVDFLVAFADLALTAGRDQGLREAKEVCEANPERQQADGSYIADQQASAAAIEQLRGK